MSYAAITFEFSIISVAVPLEGLNSEIENKRYYIIQIKLVLRAIDIQACILYKRTKERRDDY